MPCFRQLAALLCQLTLAGVICATGCVTPHTMASKRQQLIHQLEQEMHANTSWVRIHAAEALIAHGITEPVAASFVPEVNRVAPPYRMGVWRVMARVAQKPAELFQVGCAVLATLAEAFVEQAEQEVAVEGVELVLALFLLAAEEAVAEVCGVRVEEALALDEINEHQAIKHDGSIPLAVRHLADAVNELKEGFAVGVKVAVERLGDPFDVERSAGALGDSDCGQLAFFLFFERDEEGL